VAAVGGGTAYLLTRGDDDGRQTASEQRTDEAEPTDEPTEDPSEEPTEEPSEEPTDDPSDDPTDTPDPGSEPAKAFSYREFDDDWSFKLDKVRLQATFEKGWDFDSCDPVQVEGAMSALGCTKASELTYSALDGRLQVSHIVFTMDSPRAAKKAVGKAGIPSDAWTSEPETYVDGVTTGRFKSQAVNQFVVLTMETHQSSVPERQATDFLGYKAADLYGAFLFR